MVSLLVVVKVFETYNNVVMKKPISIVTITVLKRVVVDEESLLLE